ncbi:lysozyme 1B [Musca vetustissima]|uniref:lysozyme 1B n=1 Tax=Musca vetustissima TaxID=27455 RepID=UPI002AB7614A|nr:lysozyme 1B [Musca vetustissima]
MMSTTPHPRYYINYAKQQPKVSAAARVFTTLPISIIVTSFLLSSLILLMHCKETQTRRLQPCELAGQLYILDIPKEELPLWLCIVQYESRFNTHVIGSRNTDGSLDYGIFQISDKYWCKPPTTTEDPPLVHYFNECEVDCMDLMQDDITEAVKCAKLIRKQQGWSAWSVYGEFCNDTSNAAMIYQDIEIEECFS